MQTTDGAKDLGIGSIVIPVAMQSMSAAKVTELVKQASASTSVEVFALSSGAGLGGIDLGSASLKTVTSAVALLAGQGLDQTSVGGIGIGSILTAFTDDAIKPRSCRFDTVGKIHAHYHG